jgi:hypothetical protein
MQVLLFLMQVLLAPCRGAVGADEQVTTAGRPTDQLITALAANSFDESLKQTVSEVEALYGQVVCCTVVPRNLSKLHIGRASPAAFLRHVPLLDTS